MTIKAYWIVVARNPHIPRRNILAYVKRLERVGTLKLAFPNI